MNPKRPASWQALQSKRMDAAPSGNDDAPARKRRSAKTRALTGEDVQDELVRRVPPHSAEAEIAVLGGLLMRPQMMNTIADILVPDDFYLPANKIIFNAFLELYGKSAPIDIVVVAEFLKGRDELEAAGGAVYLAQLAQAVVTGSNAEYYAGLVRDKAMQRNLINACAGIIGNCFDAAKPVEELLDESEQAVFSVSRRASRTDFSKSGELLDKVFDNLSRLADANGVITGLATGYERLDALTSGMQKSDLIIVAARPSMGKTAFALCLALNAAIRDNATVGIFSLEMSKEQLMQRMLAVRGRVDLSRLRRPSLLTDEDWSNLYQAADSISQAPIFIDDSPALSTLELRARARRLKAEHGLSLIIIDYLQLMRSSRRTDSRELEISDISRSLKSLAKELDIPVIALSQLNRKVEERNDKRPILADLRESGAIEQDADVIMFVYREDVYRFKKPQERPPTGDAEIILGKQRNGPVGVAELTYISPYTSFETRAPDYVPLPSEAAK